MNDTLRDEMLKPRKVTVDGMDTRRAGKIVTLKIDDGNEELIRVIEEDHDFHIYATLAD